MVSNQDASVVYFEEGPVLFSTSPAPKTKPTLTPPSTEEEAERDIIADWGEENDFPEKARTAKESNPDLASALDWKARALYAGGIHYSITDRSTGEAADVANAEVRKMAYEIEQFLFRNRQFPLQSAIDFYDLFNSFAEVILTDDRQKIDRIVALEARNCRYKKRDAQGRLTQVYIHPDWDAWSGSDEDPKLKKITLIDPLTADPTKIKAEKGQTFRYAYPIGYPTGKNYYQLPHWWSIKVSKWLDFANMIPTVKETILKNIALIRYHCQMPGYWMESKYTNWMKMSDAEKKTATEKEFKIINDVLTKPENTGKSIFTVFKVLEATGKEYGGWKIEAVDDKMKDGALLADSSEATIKVFSGTSIDPALHGLIPGKGGSNRSGSDKREALNIYMSLIQSHEDCILDAHNLATWYNGWTNENFATKFSFKKPFLQTLNQVTPAQRATIPDPEDAD
jgi:hypothetical protein